MKHSFFKHPNPKYVGELVNGVAEVMTSDSPYSVSFVFSFQMYAPSESVERFDSLVGYKKFIDGFFSKNEICRRLREKLNGDMRLVVERDLSWRWAFEHNGVQALNKTDHIYSPFTAEITLGSTRGMCGDGVDIGQYKEFISSFFPKIDEMLLDIERESAMSVVFIRQAHKILSKKNRLRMRRVER